MGRRLFNLLLPTISSVIAILLVDNFNVFSYLSTLSPDRATNIGIVTYTGTLSIALQEIYKYVSNKICSSLTVVFFFTGQSSGNKKHSRCKI